MLILMKMFLMVSILFNVKYLLNQQHRGPFYKYLQCGVRRFNIPFIKHLPYLKM